MKTKMKTKNAILKALVDQIDIAQTSREKIADLATKATAAQISKDELTEALRAKWGYEKTAPKSKERTRIRVRVIYWVKEAFGGNGMTDSAKKAMRNGRRKGIVAVLIKHNIPQAKAAKIAAELVK